MRQKPALSVIERFEKTNEQIKSFITDFQMGYIRDESFLMRIAKAHGDILKIVKQLPKPFTAFILPLTEAYQKIEMGRKEFISTNENSYHAILFRLHDSLIKYTQSISTKKRKCFVSGWKTVEELPELAADLITHFNNSFGKFPKKFGHTCLIIKTASGWIALLKMGNVPAHNTVMLWNGQTLNVRLSDYICGRIHALRDVFVDTLGFRGGPIRSIRWEERVGKKTYNLVNYLSDLKKARDINMYKIVILFYWANDQPAVFGPTRREEFDHETYDKEIYIRKRILKESLAKMSKQPPGWAFLIFCSKMGDILVSSNYKKIDCILDKLFSVDYDRTWDFVKKEYGFKKWAQRINKVKEVK